MYPKCVSVNKIPRRLFTRQIYGADSARVSVGIQCAFRPVTMENKRFFGVFSQKEIAEIRWEDRNILPPLTHTEKSALSLLR